ncbi:hypothetical protein CY35_03G129300 [Sphagnum magellanicum]|nr:hypothetical protein CY35_03G129300 [Sphagnum magellanicum]
MHKALHTAARARGSQLKLGAGQLQRKKKREGFFSIYKTKAALFCLSHAFIQLQSVCASLELHTPHSRVSTAVYVSTLYKSLFGSPSADLVFGSPRPSADTSEGPCAVEVILNLQVVYVSCGGVTNSISRSSVWKPKVVIRRLGRSLRC